MSKEIRIEEKAAVRKKYLKFKISNLFKKYTIIKNKKYLKNNIDFENLTKLLSPYPSKYKNLIRLKLDEKKMGYATCAFVGVFMDKNSHYRQVIDELKLIPEVVETHYTTGQYALFLKVYAKDNDHLMNVLNGRIQEIKGVTRSETFISLNELINKNIPLG